MARSRTINVNYNTRNKKRYGFWNFVFDALLTVLTGGLWLIVVFIREMRKH